MHQFVPAQFIEQHLGGGSLFNIFKASLVGTPVPLCSCGVVPVGLGLHKNGASPATSVSFLIATPENGVESISLTYSFFGLPFTLARCVFAILVANVTGLFVALWGEPEGGDDDDHHHHHHSHGGCCASRPRGENDQKLNGLRFVIDEFVPSIAGWVLFGFCLSALISVMLPPSLLGRLGSAWAVPLAGLVGIPMYVCASASTPIAFSLLLSGLSPGACLVFLLTGPATNAANIPIYLKAFGRRTTAIYYLGIYVVSVVFGLVFDRFLSAPELLGLETLSHHHFQASGVHYAGMIVLTILLAVGIWKQRAMKHASGSEGCCH